MEITCQKCKKKIGEIEIIDPSVILEDLIGTIKVGKKDKNRPTAKYRKNNGLLSVRYRNDQKWGFQCECGNNSLPNDSLNKFTTKGK